MIDAQTLYDIKGHATKYKIAFWAELSSLDCFFVTRKGAFDTSTLLNTGEAIFPYDLTKKVPEAVFDAREAARCLAYENATALGFYIFRATESVLRKYYTHVTNGAAPPKVRNIGVYLNAIRTAKKGNEKILSTLKQMADLHRNPLIHPEVALTTEEAIATLGIAQSVVTAMLSELPEVATTTSSALNL